MNDQQAVAQKLSPEHLVTLYEITATMNASLDFDVALNNIMDSVLTVTHAQRGFLITADEDADTLTTLVVKGAQGEKLEQDGYSTTVVSEVMRTRQALLTNDAQFDARFQAGQSIIMRGLRAVLCAPMLVQDRLIGILYVDTSMRSGNFSQSDRDLLSAVAGQAAIALENARLYTVAVEKGRMQRELQMASEIQQSLLPSQMPDVPGYEIAARWEAAREVAGDFFDAFEVADGHFVTVIADVSDKGAPAALFMAVARTMIRSHAHTGLSPVDTLARTNDLILEDAESGMFVTAYHSHFDISGASVHVNAGHNPPLMYRQRDDSLHFMPRGGRAIGWFPDNPLQAVEIQLESGDFIVYYTDGLTEAENTAGEFYGEDRLVDVIRQAVQHNADGILQMILRDVKQFIGDAPPFDDLTVMVVRYVG